MSEEIPRYVLAPRELQPDVAEALAQFAPFDVVDSVADLLEDRDGGGGHTPGWVMLPPDSEPEQVVDLVLRLTGEEGSWSPLMLLRDEGAFVIAPVHPGHRFGMEDARGLLDGDGGGSGLLSFRLGIGELSRIRHDINNPLTAALAEVQLLLMDAKPGSPATEALQVVEAQLQRIRNLAARLTVFRSPRS